MNIFTLLSTDWLLRCKHQWLVGSSNDRLMYVRYYRGRTTPCQHIDLSVGTLTTISFIVGQEIPPHVLHYDPRPHKNKLIEFRYFRCKVFVFILTSILSKDCSCCVLIDAIGFQVLILYATLKHLYNLSVLARIKCSNIFFHIILVSSVLKLK